MVVNRNLASTGLRDERTGEPGTFDLADAAAVARDAWELGATELCIQGMIPASVDPARYLDLVRTVKDAAPGLHVHAYRPQDVVDFADRSGICGRRGVPALRAAGVDTVPGTGVKVLSERVRQIVAPGDLEIDRWIETIEAAHDAGLRSTSVLFYGHVETAAERIAHLRMLRLLQERRHGFTEFVPIPLPGFGVPLVADRAPVDEHRAMVAVSRLHARRQHPAHPDPLDPAWPRPVDDAAARRAATTSAARSWTGACCRRPARSTGSSSRSPRPSVPSATSSGRCADARPTTASRSP